jgi:hypothetical protein
MRTANDFCRGGIRMVHGCDKAEKAARPGSACKQAEGALHHLASLSAPRQCLPCELMLEGYTRG